MALSSEIQFLKMTWQDIEALDRNATLIIFPTGAIEQHGPHLPIDTDIYNSTAISEAVATTFQGKSQRVLVAPPIPWGTSPHHLGFPGTLSLRPETFSSIIFDVISSLLPHGFYRFLLLNGHGGNAGILTATVSQLSDDLDISVPTLSYWTMIRDTLIEIGESPIGGMGHACEMETSLALHMRPELVNMSLAVREMPRELTSRSSIDFRSGGPVGIPLDFLRDSKHGIMGDPTLATAEKGARIFQDVCESISSLVSELFLLEESQLRKD